MEYLKEMAADGYGPGTIGQFHHVMIPHLIERLGVGRADLIVDVGAAQGHGLIPAKKAGFNNLTAVDIDPLNFSLFRERYGIQCFECNVDMDRIPIRDAEVSLLMCFHLIEHLREPDYFLSESYRILRQNGKIALVTPDWRKQYKTFWRDPTHIHPYDKFSLARLLRIHGFKSVQTFSWGPRYGSGRTGAFAWVPKLGMIGVDMLALASK